VLQAQLITPTQTVKHSTQISIGQNIIIYCLNWS